MTTGVPGTATLAPTEPSDDQAITDAPHVRWRWLVAVPLVPAAASLVSAWGQHWVPVADGAVAAVRAADVARGHLPLLGMPASISEFTQGPQRYHPGPLLFWVLAPFTWLFGAQVGAAVGTVAVNTAAASGAIAATARSGRPRLTVLVTLATLLTGITVFGPAHLYDPFNTMLPALALLCVFVLAWRLACGDGAMLPWAILAGSVCVQTHVVYALAVLLTVGWAAVVAVGPRRWRPPGTTRPSNRCLAVSGGLTLVLWSGPLLDALRHHGGNLWLLARGTSGAPVVGPKGAVAAALHLANLPPVQFANISDSTFLRGANLSVVATTALGAWLAWRGIRSGDPILRRLLLVALGAAIAALATTSLLPDEPLKGGQMTFFKVVTPFVWLALVGCGVETWHIAPARRRLVRRVAFGLVALVALEACVPFQIRNRWDPDSWLFDATTDLTADLDRTQPRSAELRLEAAGGARYLLLLYGMVAAFDSRGRWVGVTEDRASNFGQERVLAGRPGVVTLRIQDPEVAPPAGGRLVARYRPHVDRAARRRLERELLRNAQRSGHVRLTSNGRHLLGDTLLGREGIGPAEVRSLQADPDGLLDLPPDVLASLYRNDWVVDPPLPARLHSDYVRLLGPTAVDVWAVRDR